MIIEKITDFAIGSVAASVGSTVGAAVYNANYELLDYIWFSGETRYEKDYPMDRNKSKFHRACVVLFWSKERRKKLEGGIYDLTR